MAYQAVKIGTYGGDGGGIRDIDQADPPLVLLNISLDVYHSTFITNFKFDYTTECGNIVSTSAWGTFKGNTNMIDLAGTRERLIEISGTIGMYHDGRHLVVTSLNFVTNAGKTYGPFGNPKNADSSFKLPVNSGQIISFFGRSGEVLDALGVYMSPKGEMKLEYPVTQAIKIGPYGGDGGNKRDIDDEADPPQQLLNISIDAYESRYITNFSFLYKTLRGNHVCVGPWGAFQGKTNMIDLASTGEQLTEISGTCGMYLDNKHIVITSLTFVTNAGKTYGPFGRPENAMSSFNVPVKNGQIVTFFGSSGEILDALGFYITHESNVVPLVGEATVSHTHLGSV